MVYPFALPPVLSENKQAAAVDVIFVNKNQHAKLHAGVCDGKIC